VCINKWGEVGGGLLRWGGAGKEALPFYIHKKWKLRERYAIKKGGEKESGAGSLGVLRWG